MTGLFVTATGTDIGKTHVAAGLVAALRRAGRPVAALKPLVTGYSEGDRESDPARLLAALGRRASESAVAAIAPWRWRAPLSPDMAAAREGGRVDVDGLVAFCRARIAESDGITLIEGIGGVMVPLDGRRTVLDWIAALDVRAILVTGSYLGTLSHTLTALGMLAARGVELAALVLNESARSTVALAETQATLARFLGEGSIVVLPRDPDPASFDRLAALV